MVDHAGDDQLAFMSPTRRKDLPHGRAYMLHVDRCRPCGAASRPEISGLDLGGIQIRFIRAMSARCRWWVGDSFEEERHTAAVAVAVKGGVSSLFM